jgi:hypothetical protein
VKILLIAATLASMSATHACAKNGDAYCVKRQLDWSAADKAKAEYALWFAQLQADVKSGKRVITFKDRDEVIPSLAAISRNAPELQDIARDEIAHDCLPPNMDQAVVSALPSLLESYAKEVDDLYRDLDLAMTLSH